MKTYRLLLLAGVSLLTFGCNDFLDKIPDNRAEITNAEILGELITSAYPNASYNALAELSSDNFTDNGPEYGLPYLQYEEMYQFEDGTYTNTDTSFSLWESYYGAIAAANHALRYIEEQGSPRELAAYKAEALLCRAYAHFILVNIFCIEYNETTSATDLGIPYVETPETTVMVDYPRGTVKQVYEKINRDIEAALPYVNDGIYKDGQEGYHFNRGAAYAFAARFNLFYRKDMNKVVTYATKAVGQTPKENLRQYADYGQFSNFQDYAGYYLDTKRSCNLLLGAVNSTWQRMCTGRARYGHNRTVCESETYWSAGLWDSRSAKYAYANLYGSDQSVRSGKIREWFVITDPVNEIGHAYSVWTLFTTDEALLTRAEAYVYLNNFTAAIADLNVWFDTHTQGTAGVITMALINTKYGTSIPYGTVKKELHPDFTVATGDQETLIHCILHCRRVETLMEGQRWFDIKRYGITVTHKRIGDSDLVIPKIDKRRAIQLPAAVIGAGMQPNPR